MKFVCISDTHGSHDNVQLPDGDVLIHAGDFTMMGNITEVLKFSQWFKMQPHKYKIVIAGNHDFLFENNPTVARSLFSDFLYLQDEEIALGDTLIYGTPWTPFFCNWAFMPETEQELSEKWENIPPKVDILITHGPPKGILDKNGGRRECGDAALLKRVEALKPRYHIFGHIHESAGMLEKDGVTFINAASLGRFGGINPPITFEL